MYNSSAARQCPAVDGGVGAAKRINYRSLNHIKNQYQFKFSHI